MTTTTLRRAIKSKKPAVIEEKGEPRYVILDWKTYRRWQEEMDELEELTRFKISEIESRDKRKFSLGQIKKKYNLH